MTIKLPNERFVGDLDFCHRTESDLLLFVLIIDLLYLKYHVNVM